MTEIEIITDGGRRRRWSAAGRDGWTTLALVIDCHTRELLGWHLSRSGKATTAARALEHALISRFGTLGKVPQELLVGGSGSGRWRGRVIPSNFRL